YEDPSLELLELLSQHADGTVLLGCPMDYPATLDMRPTLEGVAQTLRAIQEDFPGLRKAPIARVWAGLLPYTPGPPPRSAEAQLESGGNSFAWYDGPPSSPEELLERIGDTEGLMLMYDLPREVLERAPALQVISYVGTGVQNYVDIEAARAKGVAVCNVPSYG